MRIAVAGGGLAGLVAALRLHQDHDVTVFEREAQAGGKIRSQYVDGFLFEWGPNGFFSSSPELRDVIRDCALQDEIVPADAAAIKRYVYFGGRLHALPSKPPEALLLSLLTGRGKLRALRGLVTRPPQTGGDESVYGFFARRFGDEVAERVVRPALLGITAGDARATSMDALFPRIRELERRHGSLLKGLMRGRRARGRLLTLRGGMTRLIGGLTDALGARVERSCEVRRVERNGARWRVEHAGGEDDFDAVILAVPAYVAAQILRDVDSALRELLARISYAPMRVAGVAFHARDVPGPLDGFGFLAARDQGVRILGALYTSTIFPQQAPPDTAYVRVFLGGAADPSAMDLSPDHALATIRRDLATALAITAAPVAYHEHLWQQAIPQYGLGHIQLLQQIDVRLASLPGVALAGNAYRGVGVGDVVRDAVVQVDRLLHRGNE
jgi:oxygen-dependent protoporphyrinogen oxidase